MFKYIVLLAALVLPLSAQADVKKGLYAFETAEGMAVGAVFGVLPKISGEDELMTASSPVCDHVEIHQMKEVDGIMQMRQVPSLPVGTGQDNFLAPQGYHLMLMKLKQPLKDGETFPLTLVFKKSGEKKVDIPVLSRKVN